MQIVDYFALPKRPVKTVPAVAATKVEVFMMRLRGLREYLGEGKCIVEKYGVNEIRGLAGLDRE